MTYSPVWFTNDKQIEALFCSYESASLLSKIAGRFAFSSDVAHLRGLLAPWMRVPLVLLAQGSLVIGPTELTFHTEPYKAFGWIVRSSYKDLSFAVQRSEVLSVLPADTKSPVMRVFDLPFTRIRTSRQAPLDNFLVCVGGRIAISRIRAKSRALRESLLAWQAEERDDGQIAAPVDS